MKSIRLLISISLIFFFFLACSTSSSTNLVSSDPEYVQGFDLGIKMAEEDRVEIDCASPSGALSITHALKRRKPLEKEGKSKAFLSGFYEGYRVTYEENIDLVCD